jgi:hypothetical protein
MAIMTGLGHFPMSEDYGSFREYLLPTLAAAVKARQQLLEVKH